MKVLRLLLPLLTGTLWAAHMPMHLESPTTGILPSHVSMEFVSHMGERHGGSSLAWSSFGVTLPFLDPRRSAVGSLAVDAHMELHATFLSTGGDLALRRHELYSASVPLSLIRVGREQPRLILSVAPALASDFAGTTRYFDLTAAAVYSGKVGQKFEYSLGALFSPRFATYGIVPLISFDWQLSPQWELVLSHYRLAALYRSSERLKAGPFAAVSGGAWMVDTPEGDRLFRVSSLAAGVTAEYDFHRGSERKRILYASVGTTVATAAGFYRRNFRKEGQELHHYKPGLYVCAGVDFRF